MVELVCPWCTAPVESSVHDDASEQSCPECSTTWTFEAVSLEEMPLAA